MDHIEPILHRTHATTAAAALDARTAAEGLAKRFFVLTMIGIVVYISAILLLLSGAN